MTRLTAIAKRLDASKGYVDPECMTNDDVRYLLDRLRVAEKCVEAARGVDECRRSPCDASCKLAHKKIMFDSFTAYDAFIAENGGAE